MGQAITTDMPACSANCSFVEVVLNATNGITALTDNIKCLLSASIFALFALGGKVSIAASCPDPSAYPSNGCTLPSISVPDGSFPYFHQGIDISTTRNKEGLLKKFKAKYQESPVSTLWITPEDLYEITDTRLKIRAKFKKEKIPPYWRYPKGKVKIKGRIPELGINKKQVLMKARITPSIFNWSTDSDGQLIGFNIENMVCNEKIDAHQFCSSNNYGVVYLELNESISLDKKWTTTGFAITSNRLTPDVMTEGLNVTSVPLPAAVWLFGSGLLGLIGISRRKKAA